MLGLNKWSHQSLIILKNKINKKKILILNNKKIIKFI
jgi:hypothetical protein